MEAISQEIIVVPHEMVVENPDNPRTITQDKFDKLVNSIMEFPEMLYKRPLICVTVEDGFKPLGGNMRSKAIPEAMARLKVAASGGNADAGRKYAVLQKGIPIQLADEWNEDQRKQFVIKDNVGFGEWDWDRLANDWDRGTLTNWGLDIPDFKWSERAPEHKEDSYDETVPTKPHTENGDLYEFGPHRLRCGDSTDEFAVRGLMAGQQAHLTFTSPPYWVGKDYEYQDNEQQIDAFICAIAAGISLATCIDKGRVVINTGTASINRIDRKRKVEILPLIDKWAAALKGSGWLMRHLRIWVKRGQLPASISPKTDVIDQHNEFIATFEQEYSQVLTYWNPEGEQRGQERIKTPWAQQGVWDDITAPTRGKAQQLHKSGAAFPVELPARNILLYTKEGEIIYEPFSGSGTTIIAAEMLNRICYAQEMNPAYCDVAVRRYVKYMRDEGRPYRIFRNGKEITSDAWLTEEIV